MPINIKSAEAETLARRIAAATGESLTGAIVVALRERLDRVERSKQAKALSEQLNEIALRAASLPLLDLRSADELMGYDENGMPR